MEMTTIELKKTTKQTLDLFRKKSETYDFVINKLISHIRKDNQWELLIEGYRKNKDRDRKYTLEWDYASH